jgi:predicted dehydrogenase
LRIGVIGCGQISRTYLGTLSRLATVSVTALADSVPERAEAAAATLPGTSVLEPEELAESSEVDLVLNLTVPVAHFEVASLALKSAKHVYNEKPIATTRQQSAELLSAAAAQDLRLGCAPDTVLGTGVQTARAVVDAGDIGTPHTATAFMASPGHEAWHQRPQFYYQPGGGPLFDMGPYYLSALVHLLGPVKRVAGASSRPRPTRVVGSGPLAGTKLHAEVDTHVTGLLEHASGALTTLVMSFEIWGSHLPKIEVHGTEGSLSVPDPNHFAGAVERFSPTSGQWEQVPERAGYVGASRGYGVADLAEALSTSRPHRANGELGHHVLDVMVTLLEASEQKAWLEVASSCERPELVALSRLPEKAGQEASGLR